MVVSLINKLLIAVMLGFLLFGFVGAMEDIEDKQALIEQFSVDPVNMSKATLFFWYGYSGITPSITIDWLPEKIHPKDELLFIIEDMPLPDSTDLFLIIPLVLLTIFVLRRIDFFKHGTGIFWAIMIVLAVILLSWAGLKILQYNLLLDGIRTLGLSQEALFAKRALLNDGVKDYMPTFIIITLFTFVAVIKVYMGAFNSGKKRK